jgi:hypothetical protein
MASAQCAAVLAATLAVACGGGGGVTSPPAPATPPPVAFSSHASAHFTFRYAPMDAATIEATAAAVEAQHARIVSALGVPGMPAVTVTLYPDVDSLRAGVAPIVGSIPAFASGLVTGPTAIHVLSPRSPAWVGDAGLTAIVHEFAHCASMVLNPSIANNPRWLWESVALYEAGQVLDPRAFPYVTAGPFPTLAQLSRIEDTRIYDVGGLIGAYVVDRWGEHGMRDLVRTNGGLQALGVDEAAFVRGWHAYARERYGF